MEIWKSIKNFECLYEVSNYGNVRSVSRKVLNNGSYSGYTNIKSKVLKQTKNRLGYHVLTLFKNGKRHFKIVHRLVAEAFLDNPNNYSEVNHKDLNKSNNYFANLEWCSREYNVNHFYKSKSKTSKYKGVSFQKDRNKWVSFIDIDKKRINIGRFDTEEEAYTQRLNYINKLKTIDYEKFI